MRPLWLYFYPKGKIIVVNNGDSVWKFGSGQENFKSNMRNLVRQKKHMGEKWRENIFNALIS